MPYSLPSPLLVGGRLDLHLPGAPCLLGSFGDLRGLSDAMENEGFGHIFSILLDAVFGVFIIIHLSGDFRQEFGEGHDSQDFLVCWLRA